MILRVTNCRDPFDEVAFLRLSQVGVAAHFEKQRRVSSGQHGGNDSAAIQYCLDAAGIRFADLALVVQNANFGMFEFGNGWLDGPRPLTGEVPVVSISHHLAHAYGAYGTSPFGEAAILVLDGCGSSFDDCMDLDGAEILEAPTGDMTPLWNEKDSYYLAKGAHVAPLLKDFSPWGYGKKKYPMHPPTTRHSIGGVYAAASYHVFQGLDDAGKLMGLAPYGRPGVHDFEIFDLRDDRVFVRYDWMKQFQNPAQSFEEFKANFQGYADLAWWIQREVERATLYLMHARHARHPAPNLCYSGGVALNAVSNRRLLTEGPFKNIYIQPAAGDNGLSIGCAYYGWLNVLKQEKIAHTESVYLGKRYSDEDMAAALKNCADLLDFAPTQEPVREAADALAAGKVVGWFRGAAEFGPRALGNRSILADPRLKHVRDHINARVKFREDFRPFAPSVLAEDAAIYFDCDYASPHMLLTAPVREEWREKIPAVVHQDGSARIQTVTREQNADYYDLLTEFKARTGIGVLLNTSLNRRGMPIVETAKDALMLYMYCDIDILILDNFVVSKPPEIKMSMSRLNEKVARAGANAAFQKMMAG